MIINNTDSHLLSKTIEILNNNGVIIMKCDTIYGITGIFGQAEKRIAGIKQRDISKPFICLIPDTEWIPRYSGLSMPEKLKKYWPGPITVILPLKEQGFKCKSIALRIPEDKLLTELLYKINKPLISTSVNTEGKAPLYKIDEIIQDFETKVDLIINSGNLPETNRPSTLLNLCEKPYKVLRQGELVIPAEDLK